jgi:fatty acid desaturase
MSLNHISYYAGELKTRLPRETFAPARSRLVWLTVHLAVIVAATTALAAQAVPWFVVPALSLVIGFAFAGMTFLAHETLHAAVVRNRRLRYLVGSVALLPFVMSPRLWIAWHNRVHHGNANRAGVDPDANPTLAEYRASARIRFVTNYFALGRRSWTGVIGLLVGFSVQSAHMLFSAHKRGFLSAREHRFALAETALDVAIWAGIAWLVGAKAFLFAFGLPLLVANTIVMTFIMTNHSLSPLTEINDPLINSRTVTAPRWLEWLTLGFGYHVEHHLFPAMSSRHARRVREAVQQCWPARYQSMSLWRALLMLHHTGRVYANDTTLLDPLTGRTWSTLLPRDGSLPASSLEQDSAAPVGGSKGDASATPYDGVRPAVRA